MVGERERRMTRLYCSQGHENPADNRFCRECGEKLVASPQGELLQIGSAFAIGLIGQILNYRYRPVRELGHGGFGRTYLAEDTHRFNELCVLKEFAPQVQGSQALHKAEELFAREAQVLYKLQHAQIPRFRELFRADVNGRGRLFLVQDYIAGQTYQELLQTRCHSGQCFTELEVTQLLVQLLPVLAYIHGAGVIHRDISPDNLILRNADRLPVLIDFGGVKQIAATVAHQVNPAIAPVRSTGATRLGKAGYAPDEQMGTGEAYPYSDLYALAVTALVLLTGKEPQELFGTDRRQWKRQVKLSPKLMRVLERMLEPYPAKRYQSAQEVLNALGAGAAVPNYTPYSSTTQPPARQVSTGDPFPNTIAVAPAAAVSYSRGSIAAGSAASSVSAYPGQRSSGFLQGFLRTVTTLLATLFLITAMVAGGWWALNRWLIPYLETPPLPKPTKSSAAKSTNREATVPQVSKAEQQRKQALDRRREELGIDNAFLVSLVDDVFYTKHAIGRPLSENPEDASLRADWDKIAKQMLDRLQTISSGARSRLGSYTEADLTKRRTVVNQLNLSSRALNDLTDARFFYLFPERARNDDLLQAPIGQVWQAIATDELKSIQSGKALKSIQVASEATDQIKDTLKPGDGKAYIANLKKDQVMQLKLQAPDRAIRLSIYPPTSKSPALLEDANQAEWSGRLAESGFYEIVIVSDAEEAIDYELNLSADPAPAASENSQ